MQSRTEPDRPRRNVIGKDGLQEQHLKEYRTQK